MFYFIGGFMIFCGGIVYFFGSRYEEVSFIDKRTGKMVTRIRDKKTKKFVA